MNKLHNIHIMADGSDQIVRDIRHIKPWKRQDPLYSESDQSPSRSYTMAMILTLPMFIYRRYIRPTNLVSYASLLRAKR